MSHADRASTVLLREPWRAVGRRLLIRGGVAAVLGLLAGVPGLWDGVVPWIWMRVALWAVAAPALLLFVFTFVNLAKNRRVLLVARFDGAIEWPRSVQEVLLGNAVDRVEGSRVIVTERPSAIVPSKADPRVALRSESARIDGIPLWGGSSVAFVDRANELMAGYGVTFEWRGSSEEPEDDVSPE